MLYLVYHIILVLEILMQELLHFMELKNNEKKY